MPYATNPDDGVRIHYEVEGDGPPLVLHHGFLGSGEDWRDSGYADALSGGYRLILVDGRGFGRSDKPHEARAYAMPQRVADVTAALDDAGVTRTHFFGYSMGGHVGFGMLKHAPDRVASIIIGGMHPYAREPGPMSQRAEALRDGVAAMLAGMESQAAEPLPDPMRSRMLANDAEALIASTLGTRDTVGLENGLATVAQPSLIFAGDQDPSHDRVRQAASQMPNATFVSLEGLGHLTAGTRSDLMLPHVQPFLARVEAERAAAT